MEGTTLLRMESRGTFRRLALPRPAIRVAGAGLVLALLGACGAMREPDTIKDTRTDALEAVLRPVGGSAVHGRVTLGPAGMGLGISFELYGAMPGSYRVAIHENGICSSPNGFSAGKPWRGGSGGEPVVASVLVGNEGTASAMRTFPGVAADRLAGRSVVVHAGSASSLDAEPDRPNDRVACGVIGQPHSLLRNIL